MYNLTHRGSRAPLNAPDHRPQIGEIARLFRRAEASAPSVHGGDIVEGGPSHGRLLYVLEHRYSPAALAWGGLKGAEAARAGVLRQAAAEADWVCSLAMISIAESGIAEHVGGYGYRRGWRAPADSDDPEDYEVAEVCDHHASLGDRVLANSHDPNLPSIDVSEREICPPRRPGRMPCSTRSASPQRRATPGPPSSALSGSPRWRSVHVHDIRRSCWRPGVG